MTRQQKKRMLALAGSLTVVICVGMLIGTVYAQTMEQEQQEEAAVQEVVLPDVLEEYTADKTAENTKEALTQDTEEKEENEKPKKKGEKFSESRKKGLQNRVEFGRIRLYRPRPWPAPSGHAVLFRQLCRRTGGAEEGEDAYGTVKGAHPQRRQSKGHRRAEGGQLSQPPDGRGALCGDRQGI